LTHPLLIKHNVKVKFVIIGVWNTLFGYAVFFGFDSLLARLTPTRYIAYLAAIALSNVLSIINAYIFHKYVTFKSEVKGKGIVREFAKFTATYIVTICLSLALMPVFVEIMRLDPKIAAALVILLCVVISYVGHSRFSFSSSAKSGGTRQRAV
jgi:putative flippase GtrA